MPLPRFVAAWRVPAWRSNPAMRACMELVRVAVAGQHAYEGSRLAGDLVNVVNVGAMIITMAHMIWSSVACIRGDPVITYSSWAMAAANLAMYRMVGDAEACSAVWFS